MVIFFRVDASSKMGMGHLVRCLTLAGFLKRIGATIRFISRELPGHQCKLIEKSGYCLSRLPHDAKEYIHFSEYERWLGTSWDNDAAQTIEILKNYSQPIDWLIVDNYALDIRWEAQMRPFVKRILTIDDLANREHDCDLLLDQNLYANFENRYINLLPTTAKKLFGPAYALLRPDFLAQRENWSREYDEVKRLLIFFGGSDPTGETLKTLSIVKALGYDEIFVDVVVGAPNQNKHLVMEYCATLPKIKYYCQVDNIAEIMRMADIAIGAGGSATWERCCLGLPSAILSVAKNQEELSEGVARAGAAIYLGCAGAVSEDMIGNALLSLIVDRPKRETIGKKAMTLVDGLGAFRVTNAMEELCIK
jgi:UDP-2,4-diacetamido-2,4,6-trideoxy-beta-L-altropyranose hydrolase